VVHPTVARIAVSLALLLALTALACWGGYYRSRALPIRFHGEKVLISALVGGFVSLGTYGIQRMSGGPIYPLGLLLPFGLFLAWGVSGEITVHRMAKRAKSN